MNIKDLSVIAVDDDEGMLGMLERSFRGARAFASYSSSDEFLAGARLDACDLVLTDINMPGALNGIALTSRIRSLSPQCDVVVMTGEGTLDNALAAMKAGAYDFLMKPFSVDYLETTVDRCVEKRAISAELRAMKAAREELQAAYSQLQASERMKEAFLSVIGHELRTPLTKIIAGTELLRGSCPGREEVFSAVTGGAAELETVIESLILYADMRKEQAPPSSEPVDLRELGRSVAAELGPKAAAAGVRLVLKDAEGPAMVTGNPSWLRSALRRLVQNAVNFNVRGGWAEVAVKSGERGASVTVSDSGIGIPEELVAGLGTPFYQLAEHMTRKTGGLGLGLALVKHVVEAHNGRLSVRTVPGKGTAFTIAFSAGTVPASGVKSGPG
ncbi:MAG: response regulator [Elusimicrobia bacterium]|nr:response regulator [Elusimicrobiota bacterium]